MLELNLIIVMKKIALLFFGFWYCFGFGQEDFTLPQIFPVSPEAASLGKYGDLPVNLASGRINYSVPIFTINEGSFKLPIYLSYNHSGLLAEEDASVVGLGWTLHAGGMIIRQLRGKPDEGSSGYLGANIGNHLVIPFNYDLWNSLTSSDRINKKYNLFNGANTGRLDTQPDKFIINVANLSGNYSYNEIGEAIFYPQKNYNVSRSAIRNYNIEITDDKGIKYEFNEKENTYSEPITNNEQDNPPIFYVSAWNLTKIKFPNSINTIDLEYLDGGTYTKISHSESKSFQSGNSGNSPYCYINQNNLSMVNTRIDKKNISRINFSSGSILFDIRSSAINTNYLHSITIKDKFGHTINYYEFIYDNINSNFKLLNEVKKYGANNVQIPFYKFEYNQTPPTSIYYADQDSWGFYNGQNNSNLVNGNRSVDFSKSSIGALTKIIYPTKGYTLINYESNKVPRFGNAFLYSGQNFITPINMTEQILANSVNAPQPSNKTILIKEDQVIKIHVKADSGGGPYGISSSSSNIVFNPSSNVQCDNFLQDCYTSATASHEMQINTNADSYSFFHVGANTLLTLSAEASGIGAFSSASVTVDYFDPDLINPEDDYVEVGGLRVASTVDCSASNNCISKNYKYVLEDRTSSGLILSKPIYTNSYLIDDYGGNIRPSGYCTIKQFFTNSRIPLSSYQNAPVLYERVEILTNDNTTLGKTIKYYTHQINPSPSFPFPPINPKDWKKGNLKKEEIFKWSNDHFTKIKEIVNNYETKYPFSDDLQLKKHSIGLVAGRIKYRYLPLGLILGEPNDFMKSSYNNRPEFYQLKSSLIKEFYNGEELSTSTNYTYDYLTGYLKSKETIVNESIIKIEQIYPFEKTDIVSVAMTNKNMIALPQIIKKYKDGILLETQKTKNLIDINGFILPSTIQTSKGTNPLENSIIYHNYDDTGNPLEISKADGIHISYIWGYNKTQPIAKIENSRYVDLPQTELNALLNFDYTTGNESSLSTLLNNLRNALPNTTMVTTMTYKPLIGVSTITDPKGDTQYYEYDDFNRLKYVKDSAGNILKETEYHYRP